jgi:uncharacterized membrane protein YccC
MNGSLNIRFGVAAFLTTAVCALLLAGINASPLLGVAVLLFMPRSELTQPIPRREFWEMVGILAALIGVSAAAKYILPSSAARMFRRVIVHPAFVVPFWLFMLWGLFRHWQRQKAGTDV